MGIKLACCSANRNARHHVSGRGLVPAGSERRRNINKEAEIAEMGRRINRIPDMERDVAQSIDMRIAKAEKNESLTAYIGGDKPKLLKGQIRSNKQFT